MAPRHIYHTFSPRHEGVVLLRGEGFVDFAELGPDKAENASRTVGAAAIDFAVPPATAGSFDGVLEET